MRRTLGLVSVAIGVFLVVAAPLVKWYLAPRAARVSLGEHVVIDSVTDGHSLILDQGTLKIRTGLTLKNRQVVQGDGPAGSSKVAVWDTLIRLSDADDTMISATKERIAFDRVTGMAVNCCDEQLDGVPTAHQGLSYKFGFDTRKQVYPFWDDETRRAWPMAFTGEETRFGLTLYHFTQKIPATDVETLEAPLSLLGKPGVGSTTVHRYYENVTDVLVEPTTGIIVRGSKHTVQTLRDGAGQPLVTVADVNATYTDGTQKYFADQARAGISQLRMVRYVLPLAALIAGVVLVVLGLILGRSFRRPVPAPSGERADAPQPTGEPLVS